MMTTAAWLAGLLVVSPALASDFPASQPVVGLSEAQIKKLVADLSSPRWHVRENATIALMDAGPAAYPALRRAFAEHDDYETRLRIYQVAGEIFLTQKTGPPKACLGISHTSGAGGAVVVDPRVPGGRSALQITHVFRMTAADRAGLKPGDLIMSLNGQVGTEQNPAIGFTAWIGQQRPGTPCRLGVLRGGIGLRMDINHPGFATQDFRVLQVQPTTSDKDRRLPEGCAGFVITNVHGIDSRLRLKTGDLIVSLDDQIIPDRLPETAFRAWVDRSPRAPDPDEALQLETKPGRNVTPNQMRSMHVLRGGRWLDLDVVLGRWPRYLRPQPVQTRNAQPDAVEAALGAFASWWEAEFDPTASFQERVTPDSDWMLPPPAGSML